MVKQFEHSGQDSFEERAREALRREADTVEPSGHGLRAIQARTTDGASGRARRRWFAGGTAVLATAAAVTAVALVGSVDLGLGPDTGPGPAGPAADTSPLQIFYLDSTPEKRGEPGSVSVADPGLYREIHQVATGGDSRAESAVRELVGSAPVDPDYVNPWRGITVHAVEADSSEAVVDVSALPAAGPDRDAALQALAQTLHAATQTRVVGVTLEVDGQPSGRVAVAEPVGTYAGIWVTSPEQGTTVSSPVTFAGMAATFEGNVAYEIRRGDQVVARGATISAGGMGVWSEWSFTERLQPGEYTVETFDEDVALGGRRDVDTKDFTVG